MNLTEFLLALAAVVAATAYLMPINPPTTRGDDQQH
ncbi:hypothetical protein SAMN05443637_12818 [Pseudonocardia thermophila]|uniref:Uncharacterized protein n=1 Tax=Pseudonocardia thermophila TaxID=1848 RepID=A0A1M7AIZ4_PSETH|nr:hypothetical protein SAMN05443637_12818 [Pseudonocardia thermophila]